MFPMLEAINKVISDVQSALTELPDLAENGATHVNLEAALNDAFTLRDTIASVSV